MLSIIVGALLIFGGLAWMLLIYMAEGMNPTGGKVSNIAPSLFLGFGVFALGLGIIIFR